MKTETYRCKYLESEYDDWGKYAWCNNPNCPTKECWCDTTLKMVVCPFFEKSGKKLLDYRTKEFIQSSQKEFLTNLSKDLSKKRDELISSLSTLVKVNNACDRVTRKLIEISDNSKNE